MSIKANLCCIQSEWLQCHNQCQPSNLCRRLHRCLIVDIKWPLQEESVYILNLSMLPSLSIQKILYPTCKIKTTRPSCPSAFKVRAMLKRPDAIFGCTITLWKYFHSKKFHYAPSIWGNRRNKWYRLSVHRLQIIIMYTNSCSSTVKHKECLPFIIDPVLFSAMLKGHSTPFVCTSFLLTSHM